jgi:hypothetical protein
VLLAEESPVPRRGEPPSKEALAREEVREKIRRAHLGKKRSPEVIAKIVAKLRGGKRSAESRAKMSVSRKKLYADRPELRKISSRTHKGKKLSAEHHARLLAANLGKKHSAERRAKVAAALKGREITPEWRAKLRLANLGKKWPERGPRISAALKGKPKSPEHIAKVRAALQGRMPSPRAMDALSKANLTRQFTPEIRAKLRAARARNEETRQATLLLLWFEISVSLLRLK